VVVAHVLQRPHYGTRLDMAKSTYDVSMAFHDSSLSKFDGISLNVMEILLQVRDGNSRGYRWHLNGIYVGSKRECLIILAQKSRRRYHGNVMNWPSPWCYINGSRLSFAGEIRW
jgi:hypothetical protein